MGFKTLGPRPQTELILNHLKKAGDISAIEAQALFRARSLSRRINDLEARGHKFRREMRKDTTGQRYVRYYYIGE